MSEHDEQVAFIDWCSYAAKCKFPELDMIYAIPNGGLRNVKVAMKLKLEGVKAGIPDLHLPVAKGEYHSLYIEMKFGKNTLTADQKDRKAKLEAEGNAVVVCYTCEEAINIVCEYLTWHKLP